MPRKYRKPNWTRVDIGPTDERLIKTTGDEGFVRRDHVIKYIFEGKVSYAKIRIRKLKRFGYLKAISEKKGDPESYLLGPQGIDLVRKFYPIGLRGWGCPLCRARHNRHYSERRFMPSQSIISDKSLRSLQRRRQKWCGEEIKPIL